MRFNICNMLKYVLNYVLILVMHIAMAFIMPEFIEYEHYINLFISALVLTVLFHSISDILYLIIGKTVDKHCQHNMMLLIMCLSMLILTPVIAMSASMFFTSHILSDIRISLTGYGIILLLFIILRVRNHDDIGFDSFNTQS